MDFTVYDAKPMDIYVDQSCGKLWRCVGICHEPTVIFEEVEGHVPSPLSGHGVVMGGAYVPPTFQIVKTRQSGGVNGLMWKGWKRIWRES